MKKLLIFLTTLLPLAAQAQVADGYYRIKNYASTRYITITDDIVGGVNMASTDADLTNITTWRGFDHVKSNPASIIYVEQVGTQYNMKCQGTSIYQIAGGKTYLDFVARDNNSYVLSVTYNGVTARVFDSTKDKDKGEVRNKKTESGYDQWYFLPVNDGDNYIGLQPTVQIGSDWYGTVYASYPFKVVSSGITVYIVDGVHEGQFQLREITDDVKPAATPLLFKCSSNDPANNKVMPVTNATTAPEGNQMKGTYFASTEFKHEEYVEYNSKTMRVLGKNNAGELIFTTATTDDLSEGKYIPMNTCWLNVPNGLTGDFKLVSRSEFTGIKNIEANPQSTAAKGTYTLTGVRVDNPTQPGIYIQNGKKVVIK